MEQEFWVGSRAHTWLQVKLSKGTKHRLSNPSEGSSPQRISSCRG